MDFTASSYQQTIPSQSSFVPSDNQLEYRDRRLDLKFLHIWVLLTQDKHILNTK